MVYFQNFERYCTKLIFVHGVARSPGESWGFLLFTKKVRAFNQHSLQMCNAWPYVRIHNDTH